jgi:hypothetical protein
MQTLQGAEASSHLRMDHHVWTRIDRLVAGPVAVLLGGVFHLG